MNSQGWRERIRRSLSNSFMIAIIVVLAALVLLMLGVWYNQNLQIKYAQAVYHDEKNARLALLSKQADLEDAIIKTRDELNREHTAKEVLISENKRFKDLDSRNQDFINEFVDEFKTSQKNLEVAMRLQQKFSAEIKAFVEDSLQTRIEGKDTIIENIEHISYSDSLGWFKFNALMKKDEATGKKIMIGRPEIKTEFDVALYRKRIEKRYFFDFFPPKIMYAEVVPKNPYSTTSGMKTVYKGK